MNRACTATTAAGAPCRMVALPDTVPPRCIGHSGSNGRKTTLTADVQQRVCDALRTGVSVTTAVELAGTSTSAYYAWINRGHPAGTEPGNEPFRLFAAAVEQARGEGDARR